MVEKVKKPIQQLQMLRKLTYKPAAADENGQLNPQRQGVIEELQLEKVIGTSSRGSNSLQVNPINGDVCYMAGSHLVIYSPRDAKQIKFLQSRTQRPFQCVRFSSDGKYLAAGESAFRLPQIVIWEITYEDVEQLKPQNAGDGSTSAANSSMQAGEQTNQSQSQEIIIFKKAVAYEKVSHLQGHKYGIEAVLFSPRNDFLISLGDPNDRGLFVWDWRKETKISQNLLSKPATQVEISPKQDFFVTGGFQHLKFWNLNEETGLPDARKPNAKSPPVIQAHSVDLAKVKLQIFVGIAIEWPRVFVLASDGHIYVFDKQGKLMKWMNIKVPRAFSCTAQEGRLYCSCSDGIIRIFATETLQHLLSLSKPPPLGSTNLLAGNARIKIQQNKTNKFADVVACAVDTVNNRAVALYSDRMMFVWDVSDLKSVTVLRSMYSHSGPIHDIQVVENKVQVGLNQKPASRLRCENEDNLTKFVTCSSDRTIRFWNFIDSSVTQQKYQEIYQCLAKNAYCKDMSQMIFITSALRESSEAAADESSPQTPFDHFKAGPLDRGEDGQLLDLKDQSGINLNDMVDSIRCIRISPDGSELASGDEVGNIRIHSLESQEFVQKRFMESHDSEVISLAYSSTMANSSRAQELRGAAQSPNGNGPQLKERFILASGGRDKQILLYDSENRYEVFMNLDHHASTITSLAFNDYSQAENSKNIGQQDYKKTVELISSSADKNLISKKIDNERFKVYSSDLDSAGQDFENPLFKHGKTQICKDKIMTLDVAHAAQYLITGHDKSLCLWKLPTFERVWEKRVATMEKETSSKQSQASVNQVQLRVLIDKYASVVVSSSTSKRVTIYEAVSGKPLCRAQPGQITTAMCFSNNMRHLITTSDNGLIFVWRLPERLAQCLQSIKNEGERLEQAIERTPSIIEEEDENEELGDSQRSTGKVNAEAHPDVKLAPFAQEEVKEEDFNFDLPDKIKPTDRDNTIVKKKKEDVADVLALVNNAAKFVDRLSNQEQSSSKSKKGPDKVLPVNAGIEDEPQNLDEEDDEAVEVPSKRPENPFKSKAQPATEEGRSISPLIEESKRETVSSQAVEQQCDQTLDEETDNVAAGEHDANEADPEADNALLRKIENMNYHKRFTNYNEEESDMRLRRSSELGRKSISSKLMMRRSTTYVPGFDSALNNDSVPPDIPRPKYSPSMRVEPRQTSQPIFPDKGFQEEVKNQDDAKNNARNATKLNKDPVTDIVDDLDDILKNKPPTTEPSQAKKAEENGKDSGSVKVASLFANRGPMTIEDFQASLERKNNEAELPPSPRKPDAASQQVQPKKERTAWGAQPPAADRREAQKNILGKDIVGGEEFKNFQAVQGKPIDTRPTFIGDSQKQVSEPTEQERKRSPIKRVVDKIFGRSPQKKRVGTSATTEIVEPLKPIAHPPNVNIGNFKIQNDYMKEQVKNSPTAKSAQLMGQIPHPRSPRSNAMVSISDRTGFRASNPMASQQMPSQQMPMFANPSPLGVSHHQPQAAQKPQLQHHPSQQQPTQNLINISVPQIMERPQIQKIASEPAAIDRFNQLAASGINEEQRFNSSLQAEIDSINASLGRINSLVSKQKEATLKSQQSCIEESQASSAMGGDISMELRGAIPSVRVNDKVSCQLFKTMTHWNSMIKDLQDSTDFDIDKVSMSFQSSKAAGADPSQSMMLPLESSRSMLQSQAAITNHSKQTIKEDTRDLLDKYSQLLLESLQQKLAGQLQIPGAAASEPQTSSSTPALKFPPSNQK